jgi:ligand-binding sensor domain-containing protein
MIVWDITEDHSGIIWLATDKGLNQFQNRRFVAAPGCDELVGHPTRTLLVDSENAIWIGT